MIRVATSDELERWDELVAGNPDGGNVLQCRAFGEVKSRHGWEARYLIGQKSDVKSQKSGLAMLALVRAVAGFGELWYVPKGPGVSGVKQLSELVKDLKQYAAKAFLIKVEPELLKKSKDQVLEETGLVKAPRDLQLNAATVLLDLRPSEDEIMAAFKQKTRYNIRLAERKGVRVEPAELTSRNIDLMYGMMRETYRRAGVYTRPKAYFSDFWRLHTESGRGQLFFAAHEGQVLAAAFVTYLGQKALYKDGASRREHSGWQAPYLLQWEIMRWLKGQGVGEYDLHGTPPADRLEDKTHPLQSLAQFKTGFNPRITEFIGTYDLPVDEARYRAWNRFGERAVTAYNFRLRKRLFY
ncbi:peptidoglycan bridge formation glycyltransferase FemA/FemB family protein [Candidatus Parcubacteria bacterium]|nr:peptidoglycan bridge formation glycyltransferase FemA/FemB family protein [Candidatus Parcubacteria bacterium]